MHRGKDCKSRKSDQSGEDLISLVGLREDLISLKDVL